MSHPNAWCRVLFLTGEGVKEQARARQGISIHRNARHTSAFLNALMRSSISCSRVVSGALAASSPSLLESVMPFAASSCCRRSATAQVAVFKSFTARDATSTTAGAVSALALLSSMASVKRSFTWPVFTFFTSSADFVNPPSAPTAEVLSFSIYLRPRPSGVRDMVVSCPWL